jgi:putative ABC transport system substrate-binding protein
MLISQNIRPYIEAAEGAIQALEGGGLKVETFRVDKLTAAETDGLVASIRREAYDLVLTVGPEASSLAWTKAGEGACPIVYTMVLDPERLAGAPKAPCGISLGIPIDVQLRAISRTLPSVRQIGLMFDPGNNTAFYDAAERLSAQPGLAVIPLRVSSRKEIGRVLAAHWPRIDGVWLIPDRTIISESIVQYIIKQALLNDTPVVGYNRFFYESGAAISFVLDYAEIGAQAGRLALEAAERRECGNESPVFQTWINTRVLDKLGIPSGNDGGTVILK